MLSEDIGPRIGGTQSERDAADHIAAELDRFGCAVRLEPFPVADKFLAQIDDPGGQLADDICWQAGASPDGGLDTSATGPAVDVGPGDAPRWPAQASAVVGAIVLADDTTGADAAAQVRNRAVFVQDAAARGAAAVILLPVDAAFPRRSQAASLRLVPTSGSTPPPPTPVTSIPVLGVAQVQKRLMREDLAIRALRLGVSTTAHRNLTSVNVLGERSAANRRALTELVYISGHYDSVIGAPGANDDGSGTALTHGTPKRIDDALRSGRRAPATTTSMCMAILPRVAPRLVVIPIS